MFHIPPKIQLNKQGWGEKKLNWTQTERNKPNYISNV